MVDRKLGRGLDFFLSDRGAPAPTPVVARGTSPVVAPVPAGNAPVPAGGAAVPVSLPPGIVLTPPALPTGAELRQVAVVDLVPNPRQPRAQIEPEALRELTDSIRASGVLQPILVRRVGAKYEIVAGERRWRAAQAAGLADVPVVVRQITDDESGVFALVENLQREDLNAIEKAKAFRQLLALLQTSQEELGKKVGLDRSTVSNFLRLLELAPEVQEHVSRGTLSMGHARALIAIKDPALQAKMADEAIRRGLSVRALEELMRSMPKPGDRAAPAHAAAERAAKKAAWLKEIEESLCENLSTPIAVRYGRKSSVIQITCAGREEFERILNRLKNC